jgi:hypothetical protein
MSVSDPRFCAARNHLLKLDSLRPDLHYEIHVELTKIIQTLSGISTAAAKAQQLDRLLLNYTLQSFDMRTSKSFLFFEERGWSNRRVPELVSIAELFSAKTGILMNREAKRRKTVLF